MKVKILDTSHILNIIHLKILYQSLVVCCCCSVLGGFLAVVTVVVVKSNLPLVY